jgi:hypothetical protein
MYHPRSVADCEEVAKLGGGRVGLTIGSALDIFGALRHLLIHSHSTAGYSNVMDKSIF